MSELLNKQANVQKESLKKVQGFTQSSRKPTKKVCDEMEERNKEKNDYRGRIYNAVSEDWPNQFR